MVITEQEVYSGTDAVSGASIRRYAITLPITVNAPSVSSGSSCSDDDEAAAAAEYWRLQKLRELDLEAAQKAREAEQKRAEAQADPGLHYKPPLVSKREQQLAKEASDKQGVRMRKTGPRRKKFDPEAAEERKRERGEK